MNTGKYLKELIMENNLTLGLTPEDIRGKIHSNIIKGNSSLSKSDVIHKGGYLVTALEAPHMTIRRFIEYFGAFTYETLEFTFVINRKPKAITRTVTIPVNVAVDNYGQYLKVIVTDMNLDYKISPSKLESNVKSWVNRNFRTCSTEDRNHRSGNILSSLAKEHITWKRLLHYLLTFNPITIDVTVIAIRGKTRDSMSVSIITKEIIEHET